jgi:hypothetical protein
MKTGISVDIARPIEDVFILANDHVSAWSSIVVEDELLHLADDGGGRSGRRPQRRRRHRRWRPRPAPELLGRLLEEPGSFVRLSD